MESAIRELPMDWASLAAFVAVAEHGGFSAAAASCT